MTRALPVATAVLPLWQRAAPPRWPSTALPAAGWAAMLVVVVAAAEDPACTAAVPCTPGWGGTALEVGLLVLVGWLVALPRHAGAVAVALGAGTVVDGVLVTRGLPVPELLAGAAVLTGWTLLADRVAAARAEEAEALARAAPHAVWPGPQVPLLAAPRRSAGLRLAGALAGTGLVVLAWAAVHGAREAAAEARATRVLGTVVAHDDDYLVRVRAGDREAVVDTWGAEDYPVGSSQPLLVGEGFVRLAAEPYDPTLLGGLGMALLGAALPVAVRRRQRALALRDALTTPQPVVAVQVAPYDGDALVLAADAPPGQGPALARLPVAALAVAGDGDDDEPLEVPPQPATAYGLPLPGRAVALLAADGTALVPLGLARRPPRLATVPFVAATADGRRQPPGRPVDPAVLDDLRPERWSRALGWVLALGALAGTTASVAAASGVAEAVLRAALCLNLGVGGLLRLVARVDARADALVVVTALRRTVLPWSQLRAAEPVGRHLVVLDNDGDALPLPVPAPSVAGLPRPERRAPRLQQLADALQARIAAAGPPEPVDPGAMTRRVSPAVPAYALAAVLAVLTGLVL